MSKRAWAFIWSIFILGALAALYAFLIWEPTQLPWTTFGVLVVLATIAQLLRVEAPTHQLYFATYAFLFAGLILLPPFLFVLLVAIPYLIQWAKERLTDSPHLKQWYIQPFNIFNHILTGILAREFYIWIFNLMGKPVDSPLGVVASLLTAVVYVLLNHLWVGIALMLARKVSFRESGILDPTNLLSDFVLACLGIAMAVVWVVNPWFILPILSPLALMYQVLKIPLLQKEAQTDAKTGLLNARHFSNLFNAELQRAKRFERPLAVIMADLDLLRNVNNTYGHLAGDMVLAGIGKIIRSVIREYDIAGRFGGEEFVLVLPETRVSEACEIAERIRRTVESTGFSVQTSSTPIHVTMSLGIAGFPQDATSANDLIHQADLAVYQAKLKGRNCIVLASDVPHSAKLEDVAPVDRLETPHYAMIERELAVDSSVPEHATESELLANQPPVNLPKAYGNLFVAGVILVGGTIALVAPWQEVQSWVTILLLAALAGLAELFQVRLYGDSTVSVSATICFAAALIVGIPGVVFASLGIVLMHLIRNLWIPIYKTAFNWATHVIAATVPVLMVQRAGLEIVMTNLLPLVLVVALASVVYYLIESGLIAIAISLFESKSIFATWRHEFKWMAAYYLALGLMGLFMALIYEDAEIGIVGLLVFVLPMAVLYYSQKQYVERTEDSVKELLRVNQELTIANRQVVAANQSIHRLNDELFLTLSKIIDARDPFVSGHAAKVADYAVAIAKEMHLPPERIDRVRQSALLHDIGKIAISERVLHKPAKLSAEEYEYVKQHAVLGAEFLETSQSLRHLAPFIRHHHEWWNGKGYPNGLAREQIPLEARILAVCDAVEAMASDRAYHRALSLEQIVAELKRCAGIQFDPSVVEAFVQVAVREGTRLVVNSAREVVEKHSSQSSRPSVPPMQHHWDPLAGLTFL